MSTSVPLLGFSALLALCSCAAPSHSADSRSYRVHYSRDRDGLLAESSALRAYAAASNEFARTAAFGPVAESPSPDTRRLSWAAPPSRFVLERTDGPDGHPLLLAAFAEPLRAVLPSPPPQIPDGIHRLDVPMFLQSTGTCATATATSLLRYYGIPCLPAQLDALAHTTPEAGTDVQKLLLRIDTDILPGTGLALREHFGFSTARFVRLLREYNRLAEKRPGTRRLYWMQPDIRLERAFSHADPALLHEVAQTQPGKDRFWNAVTHAIDRGDPLLWGVILGAAPEPGLAGRPRGGHLRLVVGYRESPRAILFSDPWGPEHTAKELPLDDAWTETMTLHALEH